MIWALDMASGVVSFGGTWDIAGWFVCPGGVISWEKGGFSGEKNVVHFVQIFTLK